ncbi:MAG: DUF4783 domain-containing protein [Bacteroidota bacterium]|nr:MAG: DUF4783 domain-containing protein [Bacteroidota bacterium]
MMNWNKKLLSLLVFVMLLATKATCQDLPTDLINGFSTGNTSLISNYFKPSLELSIGSTSNVYSKTQAEIILKDFFKNNAPKSFSVLHKGGQGESKYAIGTLVTGNGTYRVTILIKGETTNAFIHQLRIDKDGA